MDNTRRTTHEVCRVRFGNLSEYRPTEPHGTLPYEIKLPCCVCKHSFRTIFQPLFLWPKILINLLITKKIRRESNCMNSAVVWKAAVSHDRAVIFSDETRHGIQPASNMTSIYGWSLPALFFKQKRLSYLCDWSLKIKYHFTDWLLINWNVLKKAINLRCYQGQVQIKTSSIRLVNIAASAQPFIYSSALQWCYQVTHLLHITTC